MEDLKEAVRRMEQAVAATPDNHPDPARWLNSLGNKLMPPSAIRLDQMDALESPELLVPVIPTFLCWCNRCCCFRGVSPMSLVFRGWVGHIDYRRHSRHCGWC
jgi:hypothetical protein